MCMMPFQDQALTQEPRTSIPGAAPCKTLPRQETAKEKAHTTGQLHLMICKDPLVGRVRLEDPAPLVAVTAVPTVEDDAGQGSAHEDGEDDDEPAAGPTSGGEPESDTLLVAETDPILAAQPATPPPQSHLTTPEVTSTPADAQLAQVPQQPNAGPPQGTRKRGRKPRKQAANQPAQIDAKEMARAFIASLSTAIQNPLAPKIRKKIPVTPEPIRRSTRIAQSKGPAVRPSKKGEVLLMKKLGVIESVDQVNTEALLEAGEMLAAS